MEKIIKLKRGELKQICRDEILNYAKRIETYISKPTAIPQNVVDGSYEEVINYKAVASDAAGCYHVLYNPGQSMSLKKLLDVKEKLKDILDKLDGLKPCNE